MKIAVIGNCGGGKSTLCIKLGRKLGIQVVHLDRLQWRKGWTRVPEHEFEEMHNLILAQEAWIMDGLGTWQSIQSRFLAADTIVFVNHPLWIHLLWTLKRQFQCLFYSRPDLPDKCSMFLASGMIFRTLIEIHRHHRPKLISLVEQFEASKQIVHISSPVDIHSFLER